MKKVLIRKNDTITNQAMFASQEQALSWLQQEQANRSFGKPERWVAEDQLVKEGEDVSKSIEMIVEPTSFGEIKLFKFPSEYEVEIVDATVEVAALKKLSDRAKKRSFGEALIDKISTINDSKNLSIEQVDAFMSNSLITNLREHLWAGNIDTFISKVQASDLSAFFSNEEKAAVVLECQQFLSTLEG